MSPRATRPRAQTIRGRTSEESHWLVTTSLPRRANEHSLRGARAPRNATNGPRSADCDCDFAEMAALVPIPNAIFASTVFFVTKTTTTTTTTTAAAAAKVERRAPHTFHTGRDQRQTRNVENEEKIKQQQQQQKKDARANGLISENIFSPRWPF